MERILALLQMLGGLLLYGCIGYGIFLVFLYVLLVLRRLKLIVKFWFLSFRKDVQVRWLRFPLASLFFRNENFDLEIKIREKQYAVRILSTRFRRSEYFFTSPKEMTVFRSFSLMLVYGVRGAAMIGRGGKNASEAGLLKTSISVPLQLEGEEKEGFTKVLLVHPVPKEISMAVGTRKEYVGNGDRIFNGFFLYSLSGFLKKIKE